MNKTNMNNQTISNIICPQENFNMEDIYLGIYREWVSIENVACWLVDWLGSFIVWFKKFVCYYYAILIWNEWSTIFFNKIEGHNRALSLARDFRQKPFIFQIFAMQNQLLLGFRTSWYLMQSFWVNHEEGS